MPRFVVVLAVCTAFARAAGSEAPAPSAVPSEVATLDQPTLRMQPIDLDHVHAQGWFGERIDRAHRAVQNLRSSIWWNLGASWGWEHAARWVRNMSYFASLTGGPEPALAEEMDTLLDKSARKELDIDYTRLPAGPYEDGEVIKGLVAGYEASGDRRLLEAAIERGRYIANHHGTTNHWYKSIAISPLVKLSRASEDSAFVDLAKQIAEEQQLAYLKENAHGGAAALIADGHLDLYEATGDPRYLRWALDGWQAIRERMFVTGGLGECLNFAAPPEESDVMCETCQVSYWSSFNLHLYRATGDSAYLDLVERILYNHFAFSQAHRGEGGGFLAYGDIDQGVRGIHNYFCCDNEGTLGLLHVLQHIYTQAPEGKTVDVNLFLDSEARVKVGAREVTLRQRTLYPERGLTRVTVEAESPVRFKLRIRIPGWTQVARVALNGEPCEYTLENSYASITREWKSGDALSVVFPMPMRVEADMTGRGLRSGAVTLDGEAREAKRIAVFYGPVVAAMFRTGHGNDLNWVWTGDYTDVLDSGGDAGLGYPASKPDFLELEDLTYNTGSAPSVTSIMSGMRVPELSWSASLGDKVQVKRSAKVLPGLPVTLEYRDEVTGWDGEGRLLCAGLRFATVKDAQSGGYAMRSVPYPVPMATTKPDLDNHVLFAGVYGLHERLADDVALPATGTFFLNNGYIGAICLYDPEPVKGVVCRQTEQYTGLYLEPVAAPTVVLSRRLVFPLWDKPQNQTTANHRMRKAAQVTAQVIDGSNQLVLTGPVLEGAPIAIPKSTGLQSGRVIYSDRLASYVMDYTADSVVVYADVPGDYRIERR